jgi:hypothetical protein
MRQVLRIGLWIFGLLLVIYPLTAYGIYWNLVLSRPETNPAFAMKFLMCWKLSGVWLHIAMISTLVIGLIQICTAEIITHSKNGKTP